MKKVRDLTFEEFKEVMTANGKEEEFYNNAMIEAEWTVSDIMAYFEHNDGNGHTFYTVNFEIGSYGYNFLEAIAGVSKREELVSDILKLHHNFCILSEDTVSRIERINERLNFYVSAALGYEDISYDKFDLLEDWVEEGIQTALNEILDFCEGEYNYYLDSEHCFEWAYEALMYEDWLVDDDLTIFEEVAPKVIYTVNGKSFDTYEEMAREYNRTHSEPMPLF